MTSNEEKKPAVDVTTIDGYAEMRPRDRLLCHVHYLEDLHRRKEQIELGIKDAFAIAEGDGWVARGVKGILAERQKDKDKAAGYQYCLETYWSDPHTGEIGVLAAEVAEKIDAMARGDIDPPSDGPRTAPKRKRAAAKKKAPADHKAPSKATAYAGAPAEGEGLSR